MTLTNSELSDALDPYRLPRHTVPNRYQLELEPDLAKATFRGTVEISVTSAEEIDSLVLNAIELEIHSVDIDGEAAMWRLDEATERLFIDPVNPLAEGDHTIAIEFSGILNDQLRGWYRSTYRDAAGNERVIATTQMQSTDCRRAFPCWDEPDFKAVFAVTLVVDPDLLAASNCGEVERVERSGG